MKLFFLLAALLAGACAHAADPGATAPYATIRWADPANPALINVGNDQFIVHTRAGIQVWEAMTNKLAPGSGWPAHTALEHGSARLAGGTVMSGSSHDARDTELHTLVWWDPASATFPARLDLPAGTLIADLLAIDRQHALACMVHFNPAERRPYQDTQVSTRLLTIESGELRWSEPGVAATRQAMLAAGVRGKVHGEGTLTLSGDIAPLEYDTATCRWAMRTVPDALAKMTEIRINPQRLPDGRMIVAHAEGLDAARNSRVSLAAPYLWDAAASRWKPLDAPGAAPGSAFKLVSIGMEDPVLSLGGDGDFEVLDPISLRWARFSSTLRPDYYVARVAPLSNGDLLVFMGVDGTVQRTRVARPRPAGELAYPHWFLGEVALPGYGLMLLNGGDQRHPQNKPEIVRVSPHPVATSTAPMPVWLGSVAGVALADGSVLAYGGLLPGCAGASSDPEHCKNQPIPPALRYFPEQDRWEEVPALRLANKSAAWPRADVQVRRDGQLIAVLDAEGETGSSEPLVSKVLGWRPGTQAVALPTLQRGRVDTTLLELSDGRMAAVGGYSQPVRIALEPACAGCPDEFVAYGQLAATRLTEALDPSLTQWRPGPQAHFAGGLAVKLANGRLFKMSLPDGTDEGKGLRAEVADAAFTRWTALPPFPLKDFMVQHMVAVGNRVLVLEEGARTVAWDDGSARWLVWKDWQGDQALSASEGPGGKVLLRYRDRVRLVPMPGKEAK
jgi:hypothetical protein